ncbi:MAG: sigma-70 family RNA polymerase sigma factor [Planctomycetes bacterium]|nr:sigma-70 family RNA polymerase sigma factor [Planctomycetota bacterium]
MNETDSTDWKLIVDAAAGTPDARERYSKIYAPLVRAFFTRRWAGSPLAGHEHDAVQEVFVACFQKGGVLERASADAEGGFRAFLRGVVRNTARRFEQAEGRHRARMDPGSFHPETKPSPEASLSRSFDRRELQSILREAAQFLELRAPKVSPSAIVRVQILKMRFREDLPVREIARRLGHPPDWVHHQYAKARQEFRRALTTILARRLGTTGPDLDAHCASLMELFD